MREAARQISSLTHYPLSFPRRLPRELEEAQTYLCSLYGISEKEVADAREADPTIVSK